MPNIARRLAELGIGVIGLAIMATVVMRPNSAALLTATADAHARTIRVMMGESAIAMRNVPRVEKLLGESDDEIITELFAGLSDTDLDWIEQMLRDLSFG
jgi:hypothetical protein